MYPHKNIMTEVLPEHEVNEPDICRSKTISPWGGTISDFI